MLLLEEEVEKLVTRICCTRQWLVLDAGAMNDMDTTGEDTASGSYVAVKTRRDRRRKPCDPTTTALLADYDCRKFDRETGAPDDSM